MTSPALIFWPEFDRENRIDGEQEAGFAAPLEATDLALLVLDDDRRLQVLAARVGAPVDDRTLGDAGRLVCCFRHRNAVDEVFELDRAGDVGEDRAGVRIPLGDALALLDRVAVIDQQARAVGHAVRGAFDALLVLDHDRHVAAHRHQAVFGVAHGIAVADLHDAFIGGFDEGLVHDLRRTTDVEGAHGELGSRLADRLRRDDADGFAHVDGRAACQVAAVALGADAVLRLAGQCRADLDPLDAGCLDQFHIGFADEVAVWKDELARLRVLDVFRRGAAENAHAERGNDLAGIDDRLHGQAAVGAAIGLVDDAVLRHVDKAAGQVAGVRRLQRRVREALAGAVGGVEVLQDGQAFLEVRDDRAFDDLAGRLGHQAAHAGKLLHLRWRTARTGVAHHVDGVHRLGAVGFLVDLNRADALHHFLGDEIAALAPGVDNLVVLFALGDEAVIVLLLVFLHERLRVADELRLGVRNDHVVLAERDAGAAGMAQSQAT